jgi:SagB-type dehydrogenase family enzyme
MEVKRMKKIVSFFWIVVLFMFLFSMMCSLAFTANNDIPMTEPKLESAVDLVTALELRKSTREFLNKEVAIADLSTILWAANGINRKNSKRTAPSAYGKYFIEIYVLSDQGVYCYQPEKQLLKFISDKKLKAKVGSQGDIRTASYVLLLTAKLNEFPIFVGKEERLSNANATAGCIGENVYLMANALKLGTRLVGSIDRKEINEGITLAKNEIPLYIMPLGYPKE